MQVLGSTTHSRFYHSFSPLFDGTHLMVLICILCDCIVAVHVKDCFMIFVSGRPKKIIDRHDHRYDKGQLKDALTEAKSAEANESKNETLEEVPLEVQAEKKDTGNMAINCIFF